MRSPKFLQADGGWSRIVWVPEDVKERVKEFIPEDLVDKIPTEKDVSSLEELRDFLDNHQHPVVERWEAEPSEEITELPEEEEEITVTPRTVAQEITGTTIPIGGGGGFKIILKNAKIKAERVIIRRVEKEEKK